MVTYYDRDREYKEPRLHPYSSAESNQSGFVDFTNQPELIESSLEDFALFSNTNAVKTFYDFLRWINGQTSHLATCDSALRSPGPHKDTNSDRPLSVHGRVFIMFRDLRINTSPEHSDWLCGRMMQELAETDNNWPGSKGVVGFSIQPAIQTEISNGFWHENGEFESGINDPGLGRHLMLSFWAYGNTTEEAFENLDRVFRNIWSATKQITDLIDEGKA